MHWQPTPEEIAEEIAFGRLYGEWDALDPAGLAVFMADYPGEWWVVGGWAIDAFTGVARPHDDIDLVIWLRDHATAPWLLDCILSEDRDGLWVSRRDPDHVLPLADVTWVAADGIRYMRPEVVLHHKARLDRGKDRADLEVAWPLLGAAEQAWLRDAVRRESADHRWLGLIGA